MGAQGGVLFYGCSIDVDEDRDKEDYEGWFEGEGYKVFIPYNPYPDGDRVYLIIPKSKKTEYDNPIKDLDDCYCWNASKNHEFEEYCLKKHLKKENIGWYIENDEIY